MRTMGTIYAMRDKGISAGSLVSWDGLSLCSYGLAWNSQRHACLCLPGTEISTACSHSQPVCCCPCVHTPACACTRECQRLTVGVLLRGSTLVFEAEECAVLARLAGLESP